ncbi:glycoside hydrolase family 27 protein [Neolewinella lacunae]|uniref:Alpha-galactosidase n=1 Tax=Neolewinella lacunae TaxID=1517758 RepID=A0A923PHJ8_9BACT|nr:glycoside hydrolase family 27 protein [Neolewinella lacunae]MBC6994253.1 glycoside hydrolase family 27 protein [Neolewinella lacunae]MDN3637129.1 glycoside hydrolase family 27 protein [Neolewinella lacunae]
MNIIKTIGAILLLTYLLCGCAHTTDANKLSNEIPQGAKADFTSYAPTPPMGWNSFDAYDCRINEEEFLAHADFMAEHLKEFGWEYVVMDYVWWHPEPGNWDTPRRKGHPNIRYEAPGLPLHPEYIHMDAYGRLMPHPDRFPSAANGVGFKAIGDYIHSKGLKFGLHIMRGVPRYAAFQQLPIKGTTYTAADIAEPFDTCNWMNHMWGVDASKPGSQAYYNSLFELYAEWGVDYIKADDMMYPPYHAGEIEMIRKAIDQCGRPMVLSLSCGEAPLSRAKHLMENANLWRISADFWDDWDKLEHNFELFNAWSPFIGQGTWPDGDMLTLGRLSLDDRPHGPERNTNFTEAEQKTMMTLWSIARSPLMMGGDLLSSPKEAIALLQNPEILAVNQHSSDNRQLIKHKEQAIWVASDPETGDRYVALFNLDEQEREISLNLEMEGIRGQHLARDLWARQDRGTIEGVLTERIPSHGAAIFRLQQQKGGYTAAPKTGQEMEGKKK